MASVPLGIGPTELIIIFGCCFTLVIIGVVVALVTVVAGKKKAPTTTEGPSPSEATKRCAVCDQSYSAEYDACPHCARQSSAGG